MNKFEILLMRQYLHHILVFHEHNLHNMNGYYFFWFESQYVEDHSTLFHHKVISSVGIILILRRKG